MILPYWVWPSVQSQKCLYLDFPFPRNKQRESYLTIHNVRFYYAIFFVFVAVIMVTAFRGKTGSKNRHFCECADGRMYLTITLLVMGSLIKIIIEEEKSEKQNSKCRLELSFEYSFQSIRHHSCCFKCLLVPRFRLKDSVSDLDLKSALQ